MPRVWLPQGECLILLAEDKEFRMSEAKRKHLEASWNQ